MKIKQKLIALGITTITAVTTIVPTQVVIAKPAATVQTQETQWQDLRGWWKVNPSSEGENSESSESNSNERGMFLEYSNGRLIGFGVLFNTDALGIIDLTPKGKQELEGTIWTIFEYGKNSVPIPLKLDINEEKDQLTLIVKVTEADPSLLPSDLGDEFKQDLTFTAQRIPETESESRANPTESETKLYQ